MLHGHGRLNAQYMPDIHILQLPNFLSMLFECQTTRTIHERDLFMISKLFILVPKNSIMIDWRQYIVAYFYTVRSRCWDWN